MSKKIKSKNLADPALEPSQDSSSKHAGSVSVLKRPANQKMLFSVFVEKAKLVHGDKYKYENYINASSKLDIICPIHGRFRQCARSHFQGSGCRKCANILISKQRAITQDEWLLRAIGRHGDKYDYSITKYIGSGEKVNIRCKIHGVFCVKASNHVRTRRSRGGGCPKCAMESFRAKKRISMEEFIKRANVKHGDKFSYSEYITCNHLVTVKCPKHGEFRQIASKHINGSGCKKCLWESFKTRYLSNTEEWVKKAVKKWGNRFDYSRSHYSGAYKKIAIICKRHGVFYQVASVHLRNCGCPKCHSSKGEEAICRFLEIGGFDFERQKRFKSLVSKSGQRLAFDFCVTIGGQIVLIEFDGAQHRSPVGIWGGKKSLNNLKRNDGLKNKFCKDGGFKMVRISDKDF